MGIKVVETEIPIFNPKVWILRLGENPIWKTDKGERFLAFGIRVSKPGLCVNGESYSSIDESNGVNAHAHNDSGVVCFASDLGTQTASLVIHELAHVLTPDAKHGRKWKKIIRDMGWDWILPQYESRSWLGRFWQRLWDR